MLAVTAPGQLVCVAEGRSVTCSVICWNTAPPQPGEGCCYGIRRSWWRQQCSCSSSTSASMFSTSTVFRHAFILHPAPFTLLHVTVALPGCPCREVQGRPHRLSRRCCQCLAQGEEDRPHRLLVLPQDWTPTAEVHPQARRPGT